MRGRSCSARNQCHRLTSQPPNHPTSLSPAAQVKLLGKNDEQLRKWELSAGKADETNVIAKLDAAFMPTKLGRAYDAVREASLDAAYRVDDALPVSATELSRRMVIQEHVIQVRLAEWNLPRLTTHSPTCHLVHS